MNKKKILELGIAEIRKLDIAVDTLTEADFDIADGNVLLTATSAILEMLEEIFDDQLGLIGEFIYENNCGEIGYSEVSFECGCSFKITNVDGLYEALTHDSAECSFEDKPVNEDVKDDITNEDHCKECEEGFCADCHCPHCQEEVINEEELNDVLDAFDALITLRNFFF